MSKGNIQIHNIGAMATLLKSIIKVSPSCEFIIDAEKTMVCIKTEDQGVRAIFTTKAMTTANTSDTISLCIGDIRKFLASIQTVIKHEKNTVTMNLNYVNGVLEYNNIVRFKLSTISRLRIEHYLSSPIKNESALTVDYSFVTSAAQIKSVYATRKIVSDSIDTVYLTQKGEYLIAEIDDKREELSDSSIGLPISDNITGDVSFTYCLTLADFSYISIIDSNEINVKLTTRGAVIVDSVAGSGDGMVSLKMVITTVRG